MHTFTVRTITVIGQLSLGSIHGTGAGLGGAQAVQMHTPRL